MNLQALKTQSFIKVWDDGNGSTKDSLFLRGGDGGHHEVDWIYDGNDRYALIPFGETVYTPTEAYFAPYPVTARPSDEESADWHNYQPEEFRWWVQGWQEVDISECEIVLQP